MEKLLETLNTQNLAQKDTTAARKILRFVFYVNLPTLCYHDFCLWKQLIKSNKPGAI